MDNNEVVAEEVTAVVENNTGIEIEPLFVEMTNEMLLAVNFSLFVFSYVVSLSAGPKAFYSVIGNKLFKSSFNRGTSKAWTSDESILFRESTNFGMSVLFYDVIRGAFSSSLPSKTYTIFKFTIAREYNSEHVFDKFLWVIFGFMPSIIG